MKALFVHSSRMLRTPDGLVYSRGSLAYSVWQRYLKHFDKLTVTTRMSDCECFEEKLNLSSGPRVHFAGVPDDHGNLLQQLQNRHALRVLRREMLECHAVIVRLSGIGWLAAREAEKRNIPWAVEVVGDPWDALWNYGSIAGKLYAPIAWWQARRWIARAPYAIYVTKEYLQKRFPCNNHKGFASNVEINPVDESVLREKIHGIKARPSDWRPILKCGLIGHLYSRYKGLHIALKALRILHKQGIYIHLHVLGAGRHEEWMQEAAAMGVSELLHLDGCLPAGAPVMQWLDSLDFYIQPSFQEGLPRALIEAMSRGLPALASTCGGIPELLPSECLHKPGKHKLLAEGIKRMVQDSEWRAGLAKRNFNEAKQYYKDIVNARRDNFWESFREYALHFREHTHY